MIELVMGNTQYDQNFNLLALQYDMPTVLENIFYTEFEVVLSFICSETSDLSRILQPRVLKYTSSEEFNNSAAHGDVIITNIIDSLTPDLPGMVSVSITNCLV